MYASDIEAKFNLINRSGLKVPEHLKEKHSQPFSKQELKLAIKQLARNKTPGLSGLTADFYKVFHSKFEDVLIEAYHEIFKSKCLPHQLRIAIINLIPKATKDSRYLKNLRPISLLNIDYKILEKMIANRLEETLNFFISDDQTSFQKGRRLATNIRWIFDLMQFAQKNSIEGFVLLLDFEKCFDKVEHTAIVEALKYFGFSPYLYQWTEIIYQNFHGIIQNNGFFLQKNQVAERNSSGWTSFKLLFSHSGRNTGN